MYVDRLTISGGYGTRMPNATVGNRLKTLEAPASQSDIASLEGADPVPAGRQL